MMNHQEGGQQPQEILQLQAVQQPQRLWRPWSEEQDPNLQPEHYQLPEADVLCEQAYPQPSATSPHDIHEVSLQAEICTYIIMVL